MHKTAIFFSPQGGSVNRVALQLGELLGKDQVDIIAVPDATRDDVSQFHKIILVGSTVGADHWDNEVIVDEWNDFFEMISDLNFKDKKLAIVGLGNSVLYPSHFADGMAALHEEITKLGAPVFGKVESKEYDFEDSEALDDDGYFCGLALDEDNEAELTAGRLENWISLLKPDFGF